MPPLISIANLTKTFAGVAAVDDVSLDIRDNEFIALLGPSGCGKTTLLRMIGGFENPDSGRITMDGEDIIGLPPNKRPLNMVFQSYAVFPHMNVRDNVAYGLKMEKTPKAEMQKRTEDALAMVRLESFADRYAHQLSGGQRQRVALARALVKRPRALLLDEPLSALDAKLREAMQTELCKLQRTAGIAFVVVTHDQDEALSMAERVAVMRDGKIQQLDSPRNLYEAPANCFVADFVGKMNILSARHLGGRRYAAEGIGDIGAADDNPAARYVAVRPEKIATGMPPPDEANPIQLRAVIDAVAYYGGETVLTTKTEGGATLTITNLNRSRDIAYNPAVGNIGDTLPLWWSPEDTITLAE